MPLIRRAAVLLALAWLVTAAPLAAAGSLDTCAQRVIRDWYAGGRVDGVYPLPCYRAAIKALPADVLAYSEADADIERALAVARRGLDARAAAEPRASASDEAPATTTTTTTTRAETEATPSTPVAAPVPPAAKGPGPSAEPREAPSRLASGPQTAEVSSSLPYPVIVLAALAGTLLLTGAAGWAIARRR